MSDAPNRPEGSAHSPPPTERFTLRVPSTFGPRFFFTVTTAVGLVVVLFARPLLASGEGAALLALLAAAALVPGLVAVLASSQQSPQRLSIEVLPDRLLLPTTGPGRLSVRYRDITALFLQRRGITGFFFIATTDRELTFPLRAFPGDEAERLLRAIRDRIESGDPDGPRRLAQIDRQARIADRAYSRRPVVILAAVAVLVALHTFFLSTGRLVGVLDAASLGAVSPELVEAAGPYLAFTSSWVHGWTFQPLLLLPALFVVGALVERLLGHGVALLVLLASSAVGGLAAAYYPGSSLTSGALVPVSGLVGALAFASQRYRGRMPIGFRLSGQWWAWVATLVAVEILIHGVSLPSLLLGFLAGVVVAGVVTDTDPELPLSYSPRWSALGAGLLAALHVGAAGWAIEELPGRGLELERIAVENLEDHQRLNEYAWQLAVAEVEPPEERLELALGAAERAVGLAEEQRRRLEYEDTAATVLHRLGRHADAARRQREVLERRPGEPSFATQLARFLEAGAEAGADLAAAGAPVDDVRVQLHPTSDPDRPYEVRVDFGSPVEAPHVLYAPVSGPDERLAGLLRVPLPAGVSTATAPATLVEVSPRTARIEGPPLNVRPAMTVPGRASAKLWALVPGYLELP